MGEEREGRREGGQQVGMEERGGEGTWDRANCRVTFSERRVILYRLPVNTYSTCTRQMALREQGGEGREGEIPWLCTLCLFASH
jgi:hypothetical protein